MNGVSHGSILMGALVTKEIMPVTEWFASGHRVINRTISLLAIALGQGRLGSSRGALAVFRPVLEPDRNPLRHARLLHGDAVEHVGGRHGLFRMGNENELRSIEELAEHGRKSADVG